MKNYFYSCFDCNKKYNSKYIETNHIYLCPECGSSNKNEPLTGVLQIFFDYAEIKNKLSKEILLKRKAGVITNIKEVLPLDFEENNKLSAIEDDILNNLSLLQNSILSIKIDSAKVLLMDETRNITLSYKDRASILVALKAKQLGIDEIACASTGNAGSSMAGIASRLGIKSHIYVPQNIPSEKLIQIKAYGANVHQVKGDYDLAFDTCLEDSIKHGWYNRNTAYNPLTIEGKKTAAYDMFIQTKGELPDNIFVPVGDGVIISGLYKGFWELKELGLIKNLPRLIAVQAEGSCVVSDYLVNGKFLYKTATSVADSICAGAPRNLFMAADAIKKSDGEAVVVSDSEILVAQKTLATNYGILAEPSAAASLAGYSKMIKENDGMLDSSALLLITGNGLKDISSFAK